MSIDAILISIFLVLACTLKTRDALVIFIAMATTFAYSISSHFDSHSMWANHITYSLIALPALWFLTRPVAMAVLCYTSLHWLVAGQVIFLPEFNYSGNSVYMLAAVGVEILIMVSLYNGNARRKALLDFDLGAGWLPHYLHDLYQHKEIKR